MSAVVVVLADTCYSTRLRERLGEAAPAQLNTLGNINLLKLPKTGLFCSARCPGNAILRTYDQAAHWRDTGRCVISGFHSSVEQECLRILLRGTSPIILCPARKLPMRVQAELQSPLAKGRLLILSSFFDSEKRVTTELANRRNILVAALADDAYFGHITVGGKTERLSKSMYSWKVPFAVGDVQQNILANIR
jgi:predicted Rossmann fold nucleotide-binding protein DprA/Smf involved in DNA uptake